MEIFKIAALGLAGAVLAVFIKNQRAEFAISVSLISAVIIFAMVLPYFKVLIKMFGEISNQVGLSQSYVGLILKVIGIAYAAQFASELCRDAGECAIAAKIELSGKVIIMTLSMPVLYSLLEVVSEIINFG